MTLESSKLCVGCAVSKPTTDFHLRVRESGTITVAKFCKPCTSSLRKAYCAVNVEKLVANKRRYYLANKQKCKSKARNWAKSNRERHLELRRKCYARNRGYRLAQGQRWRDANRPRLRRQWRERLQERLRTDPVFKLTFNLRCRINQAIRGRWKRGATVELLGAPVADVMRHLELNFRDGMTWANHGSRWHIDHTRPCASFDLSVPAQQRECFHFSNLQPLWKEENLSKGAKYSVNDTP